MKDTIVVAGIPAQAAGWLRDGIDDIDVQVVETTEEAAHLRAIPVVVMTAKDITEEDRLRLNGNVARVLQKGSDGTGGLLQAIRDLTSSRPLPQSDTSSAAAAT